MRTRVRIAARIALTLVTAAALTVVGAAAAPADPSILTPDQRARLDPAGYPAYQQLYQQGWGLSAQRDGAAPGSPGNRHVAQLDISTISGYGAPDLTYPQVRITLLDYQCPTPTGACTLLRHVRGTMTRPSGLQVPFAGTARLRTTITGRTPGITITRAAGVPDQPVQLDLAIAPPQPWNTTLTLANASSLTWEKRSDRARWTGGPPSEYGRTGVPSGTLAGITLGARDGGPIVFAYARSADLPRLPVVRTAAQRAEYLPRVANGRIVDDRNVHGTRTVFLGSAAVAKLSGRLPGNRHLLSVGLRESDGALVAHISSRDCGWFQPWSSCTSVGGAELTPVGTPSVVHGADGAVTASGTFSAVLSDGASGGQVRITSAWGPGSQGAPQWSLVYSAINMDTPQEQKILMYEPGAVNSSAPRNTATFGGVTLPTTVDGDQTSTLYYNWAVGF